MGHKKQEDDNKKRLKDNNTKIKHCENKDTTKKSDSDRGNKKKERDKQKYQKEGSINNNFARYMYGKHDRFRSFSKNVYQKFLVA